MIRVDGSFERFRMLTGYSIRNVIGISPMQLLAWFTPMAIGGCVFAIFGGHLMHLVSGSFVLSMASIGNVAAPLLVIFAPENPSYWVYIFPAMVYQAISMDLTFSQVNVFLSTELQRHQQAIAGSLSHALVHLSAPLLLGLARELETYPPSEERSQRYAYAFWLQLACGMTSVIMFTCFVRIEKAVTTQATSLLGNGKEV